MSNQTKQKEPEQSIEIPLHFNLPIDKPSVYATNMVIQVGEHEVIISFYEAQAPFFAEGEDVRETLQKVGVRADCVAKVTVAKERFAGFAKVISGVSEQMKKGG